MHLSLLDIIICELFCGYYPDRCGCCGQRKKFMIVENKTQIYDALLCGKHESSEKCESGSPATQVVQRINLGEFDIVGKMVQIKFISQNNRTENSPIGIDQIAVTRREKRDR